MTQLNDLVVVLAEARDKLESLKQERAVLDKEIAAQFGEQQFILNEETQAAKLAIIEADAAFRRAAIEAFEATGDKKPHPAVSVGEYTVLDYDERAAFEYCYDRMPDALKLDKRAFERIAKVTTIGCVAITKEPRAKVASDLSAYVPEEEEAPF